MINCAKLKHIKEVNLIMLLTLKNTTNLSSLYCKIIDEMIYLMPKNLFFSHFKHEGLVPGDREYFYWIPWLLKLMDWHQNYAFMMTTIGDIYNIRFFEQPFSKMAAMTNNTKSRDDNMDFLHPHISKKLFIIVVNLY